MSAITDVLFHETNGHNGHLGIITLNRPDVLNSLNLTMVRAMHAQLSSWAKSPNIKAVVIRAKEGRAFCAGGDLRSTYERQKANDVAALRDFFREEYQLNRLIHHYQKPYIAILDGITMGGGVGISIHGSHRIATERLLFAMPETGIGFFPDVGGTFFLPRIAHHLGFYLGLTGARISCDDALALQLVQHKMAAHHVDALIDALNNADLTQNAKQKVTDVIAPYQIPLQKSSLTEHHAELEKCFSKNSLSDIFAALQKSSSSVCKDALKLMMTKSPISLCVTLRAMQEGLQLDFDTCMQHEYRLTCHFLESHDFVEGIRAVIIDKDQKPIWQPNTINDINTSDVDHYFKALTHELALTF